MTSGDERFAQSMADLSGRMRLRMAERPAIDPITALKRRQAALKEYDRERRQQWLMLLGGLGCVAAAGALAWAIVMIAEPGTVVASTPTQTANVQTATVDKATVEKTKPPASPSSEPAPARPTSVASSAPPPVTPPAPPPETVPASIEATSVPAPDPAAAPKLADKVIDKPIDNTVDKIIDQLAGQKAPTVKQADATPPATPPAPGAPPVVSPASSPPVDASPPRLPRSDVAEAQRLLAAFGFDPGPIDGSAGPRTLDAVSHYQEKRGLLQTGELDRSVLDELRQDPAPKVAVATPAPRPSSPPQYAQADRRRVPPVFRPIEAAGQQITNWLNTVFR